MADYLQVSTATPTQEQALELARTVVSRRLAAGAQIIGPVISAFWHGGKFGTGEEWQLLKTVEGPFRPGLPGHQTERVSTRPQLSGRPSENAPRLALTSDHDQSNFVECRATNRNGT
ncbi:divalent cation tolerance protein CutA [Streptomyces murinus]